MTPLLMSPSLRVLDGFIPSWIGSNPFEAGIAIGSEEGEVVFVDAAGKIVHRHEISPSHSAINGVAGFGDFLAVSTWKEVSVFGLPGNDREKVRSAIVPRGAHSVISNRSGEFIAPLGPNGLAIISPSFEKEINYHVTTFDGEASFYQVAEAVPYGSRRYLLAACRSKGVGILDFSPEEQAGFQLGSFAPADVVEVISVPTASCPWAMIAVGTGGEVFLWRDFIQKEPPIQLHYRNLAGPVYRAFVCFGHIVLLTPRHFYVLVDLAGRLIQPVFDYSDSPVLSVDLPEEAVEGHVEGDTLYIACDKGLMVYNLADLQTQLTANRHVETFPESTPSQDSSTKTNALSQLLTHRLKNNVALPKVDRSAPEGPFVRFSSSRSKQVVVN